MVGSMQELLRLNLYGREAERPLPLSTQLMP